MTKMVKLDLLQRIIIVFISHCLTINAQFSYNQNTVPIEGDSCWHQNKQIYGICANPNNCEEVVRDYSRGIQPQLCSYRGTTPIVCCPQRSNAQSVVQPLPIQTTSSVPVPAYQQPSAGRLSEQKCEQYSRLTQVSNVVGTFSLADPISTTVQRTNCLFTGGDGFIVGGTVTFPGEFPHMALIGWQEADGSVAWNCGGSLISYNFIMTAAHCASNRGIPPNIIRLGEQDYNRQDEGGRPIDYSILSITKHPQFKTSSKYYDIALIQVASRVEMSEFTRPACLWQSYGINIPSVTATGWGLIKERGAISTNLLKVSLKVIDNNQCSTVYNRYSNALRYGIMDSQMCAGDDNEEKDTCQGDSGGPIQLITSKYPCSYYIVGITSFGKGCGAGYGVYTRVSQYLDWIESVVWQNGLE